MTNLLNWMRVSVAQETARSGIAVKLKWIDPGAAEVDPTTGAYLGSGIAPLTEDVKALSFYEVEEESTKYRMFAEVTAGNGILDLPVNVTVLGRAGLVFEINGEDWVQKNTGEALRASWQNMDGERVVQTYLLRRQT